MSFIPAQPAVPVRQGRRLVVFLVIVFLAGIFSAPVGSLLAVYVDSTLHQPPAFTATLKVVQLAMTGVFAVIGGAMADRFGRKRVLVIGLAGVPLGLLLFSLHDFWILAIGIAVFGVTSSLQTVGGQSFLVTSASDRRLGASTSFYYLGSTLGGALGNGLAATAAERFGFERVAAVGALLSLVLVIVATQALSEPLSTSSSRRMILTDFVSLLREPPIALVGTLRFVTTCLYGSTSLLLPLLVYRLGGSIAIAGFFSTISLVVATGAQLMVGRIVDRYGAIETARVLTIGLVIAGSALGLSVHALFPFFLIGVLVTSLLWGMSTTMPSLARMLAAPERQGRVLGLLHFLWSAGMLVGTAAGGALVSFHPSLPFFIFSGLNLGSVVAVSLLARRTRAPR